MNQKGIAHLILIFILLLGIIVTVFLVGKTQIFKPKASSNNIEFSASTGKDEKGNACEVKEVKENEEEFLQGNCRPVKVKFTSPIDTQAVSDAGDIFVETAYALSDQDYFCNEAVNPNNRYYKSCGLPFNLCALPGGFFKKFIEDTPEECPSGQVCKPIADIFNNGARCIPSQPEQKTSGNFQPQIIVKSNTTPQSSTQPLAGSDLRNGTSATPIPSVAPVPQPAGRALAQVTPTPTPTLTPSPTPTGTTTPTPTPTASSNLGTGTTEPPAKVTLYFRFAESEIALVDQNCDETVTYGCWQPYTQKGSSVIYTFRSIGKKFIYAQFKDNYGTVYKSNPWPARIVIGPFAAAADKLAADKTTKDAADKVGADKTAINCKVEQPTRDCSIPNVEKCSITTLADIGNCTNAQLIATLTHEQLQTIPVARIETFTGNDLMCFFDKSVLVKSIPSSRLKDLGNAELLAIADSTGDCRGFLSHFSCDRLQSFTQDIKDSFKTECSF